MKKNNYNFSLVLTTQNPNQRLNKSQNIKSSNSPKTKGKILKNSFNSYYSNSNLLSPRIYQNKRDDNRYLKLHLREKSQLRTKKSKKLNYRKKKIFQKLENLTKDQKNNSCEIFEKSKKIAKFKTGKTRDHTKKSYVNIKKILDERVKTMNSVEKKNPEFSSIPTSTSRRQNQKENEFLSLLTSNSKKKFKTPKPNSKISTVNLDFSTSNYNNNIKDCKEIFKSYSPKKISTNKKDQKKTILGQYLEKRGKSPLSSLDISITKKSEKIFSTENQTRKNSLKQIREFGIGKSLNFDINKEKVKKLKKIASSFTQNFHENRENLHSDFPFKRDFEILIKFAENLCDENTILEEKLSENYIATQSLLESCRSLDPSKCKKNQSECLENLKKIEEFEFYVGKMENEIKEKDEKIFSLEKKVCDLKAEIEDKEKIIEDVEKKEKEKEDEEFFYDDKEKFDQLREEFDEEKNHFILEIVKKNFEFFLKKFFIKNFLGKT